MLTCLWYLYKYKQSENECLDTFKWLEILSWHLICLNKIRFAHFGGKTNCVCVCKSQAGGKAGKDSGKAKAKAVSRSQRAGLQVSASININVYYFSSIDLGVLGSDQIEVL